MARSSLALHGTAHRTTHRTTHRMTLRLREPVVLVPTQRPAPVTPATTTGRPGLRRRIAEALTGLARRRPRLDHDVRAADELRAAAARRATAVAPGWERTRDEWLVRGLIR